MSELVQAINRLTETILGSAKCKPLMTVADMAAHYRLTESTINQKATRGEMPPAVRTGKRVIGWRPETVDAWDKEHERELR